MRFPFPLDRDTNRGGNIIGGSSGIFQFLENNLTNLDSYIYVLNEYNSYV